MGKKMQDRDRGKRTNNTFLIRCQTHNFADEIANEVDFTANNLVAITLGVCDGALPVGRLLLLRSLGNGETL